MTKSRSNPRVSRWLLLPWLLMAAASVLAAGLTAEVDRSRLGLNETLTLRVSAEGWPGGEPDFSPLEGDFEILDRSVSTRMSVINGETSQTREWTVVLAPRREGELSIPPISAGGSQSSPLQVQVLPEGRSDPDSVPRPLRLETRVDLAEPYVQQAFTYRVRVLFREQPRRMSLTEPVAEGATIEPAGDDQSYSEMIDGRRYTVIERSFLVVPQRSGPLTIRSPRLEAVVPEDRPGVRRSPLAELEEMFGGRVFQGFPGLADTAPGRRVVERGADQQVEVRPQPDGAGPVWLPAESVQLSDEWAPSPPVFRVGEPVTRILTITASGTTAASLPDLAPGNPDGANLYPEQPRVEDLPGPGGPAAVKSLKIAVVPSRAGDLTLPEIRLPWWDVVQDRARVAVIPQRTVQVEPAVPMAAPSPAPAADPAPVSRADRAEPDGLEAETEAPAVGDPTAALSGLGRDWMATIRDNPWAWLAALLGSGWLLTLAWILTDRRRRRAVAPPPPAHALQAGRPRSLAAAGEDLRRACRTDDPRAARDALLAWGQARWPEDAPRGLGALAARLGEPETDEVLDGIDRAIYAQGQDRPAYGWDGNDTWLRLEPLLERAAQSERAGRAPALPGLYPRGV